MKHLDTRNIIGLVLLAISLVLLFPGLNQDILSLNVSFNVPFLGAQDVFDETRSIMGTIQGLFEEDNAIVAVLILVFSVVVPVAKALALFVVLLLPQLSIRRGLHRFVGLISKWSMADVFVVGVFIAFLSTRSNDNVGAELHRGFYFFLGYCLVSIAAVQVIRVPDPVKNAD
ncbi:MAG: paraquat-inducible protein A [Bacteroidota bacterium]